MSHPQKGETVVTELISWIYDRPHMYCRTLGELDTLLYYLHFVWAQTLGTRESYEQHRSEHHIALGFDNATGPVSDEIRTTFLEPENSGEVEGVIAYWKAFDDRIGLATENTTG